jgi:hypothetical protein
MGEHKTQRMALALTLLEPHHKDGDESFSHIVRVTGDGTWFYLSTAKPKSSQQSKQWMHTHSPKKPNNKRMPGSNLMATVLWGRKGLPLVEFAQQGTPITSKMYCFQSTKKQKAWNSDI